MVARSPGADPSGIDEERHAQPGRVDFSSPGPLSDHRRQGASQFLLSALRRRTFIRSTPRAVTEDQVENRSISSTADLMYQWIDAHQLEIDLPFLFASRKTRSSPISSLEAQGIGDARPRR